MSLRQQSDRDERLFRVELDGFTGTILSKSSRRTYVRVVCPRTLRSLINADEPNRRKQLESTLAAAMPRGWVCKVDYQLGPYSSYKAIVVQAWHDVHATREVEK